MEMEKAEDTALHEAVRFGDLDEVSSALSYHLDPNQIGLYQWSPLHEASHNGDIEIIKLLLENRGDPNKKDELRGHTAVHYAAIEGHSDCLRLLLQYGGRFDVKNNDGNSCLDLALPGECRILLQEQKELDLSDSQDNITRDEGIRSLGPVSDHNSITNTETESEADSLFDIESLSLVSIGSDESYSTQRSWNSDKGIYSLKKNQNLGHIQISFEFNSKKKSLKIRIWEVSDLLLPPVDTSMISTMYVKSRMYPDKKNGSKRKTEEIAVTKSLHQETKHSNTQGKEEIFKPVTIKFTKALEYNDVTDTTLEEKVVELQVCVTQKYSRRSFVIASWHLALSKAVKILLKKKCPLKPQISLGLPENMKVYDASDISVSYLQRNHSSSSSPNLNSPNTASSLQLPNTEKRAVSDSDLNKISTEKEGKRTSIEVNIPKDMEEIEDFENALQQIAVLEQGGGDDHGSLALNMDSLLEADDNITIQTHKSLVTDVMVHMPPEAATRKSSRRNKLSNASVKRNETKKENSKKNTKPKICVSEYKDNKSVKSGDLEWDHFEEPLTIAMVPINFEDDTPENIVYPILPMDTSLEVAKVHRKRSKMTSSQEDIEAGIEMTERGESLNSRITKPNQNAMGNKNKDYHQVTDMGKNTSKIPQEDIEAGMEMTERGESLNLRITKPNQKAQGHKNKDYHQVADMGKNTSDLPV